MLSFDEAYFQDEERDGFLVTEEIKRLWAAQLVVLSDIDKVCRKHHITWFTAWGTTIGAARHGGYIPWDDDLDICMKRRDYMKFLQVAEKELPKGYSLLNYQHDKGYHDLLTRVLNGRQFDLSEEHLRKFYGCPYLIGVDIFPLDYIPRKQDEYFFIRQLLTVVQGTAQTWQDDCADLEQKRQQEEAAAEIEKLCAVTFDWKDDMKRQLIGLSERLCMLYTEEDADDLGFMIRQIEDLFFLFPKSCFDQAVELPFETTTLPVPKGYNSILTATYGNWRVENRSWSMHNYPYTNMQKPWLEEYKRSLRAGGVEV